MLLFPIVLSAQLERIAFRPPSSASLITLTDHPVRSNNGVPEIVLPLHTLTCGSLSLPLSLEFSVDSYIRPNQLPDSPGAGWSLTSDLQITRQIRGEDDFGAFGYLSNPHIPSGYDGHSPVAADQAYLSLFYTRGYDEEPDKYYYRLADKVGTFYFRKNADGSVTPVSVPYNGARIVFSQSDNLRRFIITDTDGTIYEYSDTHSDYEHSTATGTTPTLSWKCDRIVSASHADTLSFAYIGINSSSICGYTPTGVDVYDSYSGSLVSLTPSSSTGGTLNAYHPVFVECPYDPYYTPDSSGSAPPDEGSVPSPSLCIVGNPKYTYNEVEPLYRSGSSRLYIYDGKDYPKAFNYIHPSPENTSLSKTLHLNYPSEIRCRGGRAEFFYASTLTGALDSILIKDALGSVVKRISFRQYPKYDSSLNLADSAPALYSRRLDSLTVNGDIYTFAYHGTHSGGIVSDFWGYGYDTYPAEGSCFVPQHNVTLDMGSASLFTDLSSATIDIGSELPPAQASSAVPLLSVCYPTGGVVRYCTERHRYKDSSGIVRTAGGMRIARIDYYTDTLSSPVRSRYYRYGIAEDGCGTLKQALDFDDESGNCMTCRRLDYYHVPNANQPTSYSCFGSERLRSYLPHPTFSPDCGTGSWVIYSEIAEYDTEDGSLSGKTVSHYDVSSLQGKIYRPTLSVDYPLEGHLWDVGVLDSVVFYKRQPSGNYIPTRSLSYTYNEYRESETIFQGRLSPSVLAVPVGFGGLEDTDFDKEAFHRTYSEFIYSHNALSVGCMQLTSRTERIYENDESVRTATTEYTYSNPSTYFRPSITSVREWDGSLTLSHQLYASDYSSAAGDTLVSLRTANIISHPVEQVVATNGEVVSALLNIYDENGNVVKNYSLADLGIADSDFRLSNGGFVGSSTPDTTGSFSPDYTRYRLDAAASYDEMSRLCELQQTGESPICYLWGYGANYPVAEIENAIYTAVDAILPAVSEYPTDAELQTLFALLRERLPEAHVNGYTYRMSVGISSHTDPSGRTLYYEYDSSNRLCRVCDENGNPVKSPEYTLKEREQ